MQAMRQTALPGGSQGMKRDVEKLSKTHRNGYLRQWESSATAGAEPTARMPRAAEDKRIVCRLLSLSIVADDCWRMHPQTAMVK